MYVMDKALASLFFALVALKCCFCDDDSKIIVNLKADEPHAIRSPGYPNNVPPHAYQSWEIIGPKGSKVELRCTEVNLEQPNPPACGDEILIVYDRRGTDEICGRQNDYLRESSSNEMSIQFYGGRMSSGRFSCSATAKIPVVTTTPEPTEGPHYEEDVELVAGGELYQLQSPNYPEPIAARVKATWRISTSPNNAIRISCWDIRLAQFYPPKCLEATLKVIDGDYVQELCGAVYDFNYLSSGNKLVVELNSGKLGQGGVSCQVRGRVMDWYGEATPPPTTTPPPFKGIESEEVDSEEHGGPPGPKTTTCKCGWANKASKRIVNGIEAGVNEYPFMAALYARKSKFNFCGASILTPYHAITAAHCTWRYVEANEPLSIMVGDHDLYKDEETNASVSIDVKQIIQHAGFDKKSLVHDIAILVLEQKVEYNKFVGPVCLPSREWLELSRQYVTIIGWGQLKMGGGTPSRLQKVHNRVVHWETCRRRFRNMVQDVKSQICTYSVDKDVCKGDSGGPVLWVDPETNRYTLMGLVSFGTICGGEDPAVHTAVSAYIDWIEKQIQNTMPHQTCTKAD